MENQQLYYPYSEYLKRRHGEKVYKLPVNLPVTCPNRMDGKGCIFCAGQGTGFEAMDSHQSVTEQIVKTRSLIENKYHAHKFIAYFQNYTNTYLPVSEFERYIREAVCQEDIVEVSVSTRPDCISKEYLEVLRQIKEESNIGITVELGLQTVNYHTLQYIQRGHTLAEYINAVLMIQSYGFEICTHVILNLPGDDRMDNIETAKILSALHIPVVKIHSLYIAKNTQLCEEFENGTISVCSKEAYMERLITFLEYLNPCMAIERLFSRVPEKDAVFSNWGTSWWKLKDETLKTMTARNTYQGRLFHYLNGPAVEQFKKM